MMSIFFQNPTNYYKIILLHIEKISVPWSDSEIVVTGTFGAVKEDDTLICYGHLVNHPKYGRQFAAERYEQPAPSTEAGLVAYLAEKQFKGIGPKTAQRIVDRLGENAITKIIQDPTALTGLGLPNQVQTDLVSTLKQTYGMERVMLQLNAWHIPSRLASAIYQKYQGETLTKLAEDPYRLVSDVTGIGFRRADEIAAAQDFTAADPHRVRSAIRAAFDRLNNADGAVYTDVATLLPLTQHVLSEGVLFPVPDVAAITAVLKAMVQDKTIVSEHQRLYLTPYYEAEWQIASGLTKLAQADIHADWGMKKVAAAVTQVAKNIGVTYDTSQSAALTTALTQPVFLLTGGPGTGKTTVIRGLIGAYAQLHHVSLDPADYTDTPFPIQLAAPTGRAAKRMSELTGLPAGTIHRLLGLTGRDPGEMFTPPSPVSAQLVIIDEMSMVDMFLFRQLIKALTPGTQLVLVGDKDQLPSVGPGQVFADLLSSQTLPAAFLTKIHRQAAGSSIVQMAHDVNDGLVPPDLFTNHADRSFFRVAAEQVPNVVGQIVAKAAKKFDPLDIQVLAPMYRGPAGVTHLNDVLQDVLNPATPENSKEIVVGTTHYRIGDKVLQLVNDPEHNVFNGEIGKITSLTPAKQDPKHQDKLTVAYDETEVTYDRSDFNNITRAYCTTIHKAQGSEFPLVILPVVHEYGRMLERNLLYTAITRTEKLLILVGEESAVTAAIDRPGARRATTLDQRLLAQAHNGAGQATAAQPASDQAVQSASPAEPADQSASSAAVAGTSAAPERPAPPLTYAMILQHRIDPMIGMTGVTPAQFMPGHTPTEQAQEEEG
ncbi:YrrC [Schleiferilactobacillus shenzhenensis LY-73]|uniref:ATP-dependent RecD2 DNA helicase n=1 Tax=Schleiferilactobacillus shenzhenensis LY-73 TaxID=1231336 RepID=U4TXF6_9LACO|nr:YrrC [Schleiferilactobacillus shenzhenensis LY-73]